jgi:hypothetical protein
LRRRYGMALEDYLESEVVVAVAATAAVLSPRVRGVLRRGAVYGLAGVLRAGDAISSAAPTVSQGAQQAAASAASTVQDVAGQARAAAEGATDARTTDGEPR